MAAAAKDSWTVETERMTVTLVSEPIKLSPIHARQQPGEELPRMPSYVLLVRRGGAEPVRIEAEDAELLMWMLMKLPMNMRRGPMPMAATIGEPIG